MSNNQTEQLKAQALQLRNIKSNLENQAAHSQIVLNGATALAAIGTMKGPYSEDIDDKIMEITKFVIQALHNMFVPPAPPQPTKEMMEAMQVAQKSQEHALIVDEALEEVKVVQTEGESA